MDRYLTFYNNRGSWPRLQSGFLTWRNFDKELGVKAEELGVKAFYPKVDMLIHVTWNVHRVIYDTPHWIEIVSNYVIVIHRHVRTPAGQGHPSEWPAGHRLGLITTLWRSLCTFSFHANRCAQSDRGVFYKTWRNDPFKETYTMRISKCDREKFFKTWLHSNSDRENAPVCQPSRASFLISTRRIYSFTTL